MAISLCMIVRDEEPLLPGCLESVRDFVDELLIIDTGSKDRTVELARQSGADVYHFDWIDDFAAARNFSISKATKDWILVLDADQKLLPEVVPELNGWMEREECLAVDMLQQEVGSSQNPYAYMIRLFRNHEAIRFRRPYHELVDDSIASHIDLEPRWKVGRTNNVAFVHSGFQAENIAAKGKEDRALRIMKKYHDENPEDSYIASKLGALLVSMGDMDRGTDVLRNALQTNPTEEAVRYELKFHLAMALQQSGNLNNAGQYFAAAMDENVPDRVKLNALINFGNLMNRLEKPEIAIRLYNEAISIEPGLAIAHMNLGVALRAAGKQEHAIESYKKAISLSPNFAEAHENYGIALLKEGKNRRALKLFRKAVFLYKRTNPQEADRLVKGLDKVGLAEKL